MDGDECAARTGDAVMGVVEVAGIEVETDDGGFGADAPAEEERVTAQAGGAVDRDLARLGVQNVENFVR